MRKLLGIILSILILILLLCYSAGDEHFQESYDSFDTLQFAHEKNLYNYKKHLKYGMSWEEVSEKFGEPDNWLGTGFVIVGYRLHDGNMLVLHMWTGNTGLRYAYVASGDSTIGNIKVISEIKLN